MNWKIIFLLVSLIAIDRLHAQKGEYHVYAGMATKHSIDYIVYSDTSILILEKMPSMDSAKLRIVNLNVKEIFSKTIPIPNMGLKYGLWHSLYKSVDGGFLIYLGINEKVNDTFLDSNSNLAVLKLDSNFNLLWTRKLGSNKDDYGDGIIEARNGDIYVYCSTTAGISLTKSCNSFGGYDIWIVKLDKNGNILWDKAYGGSQHEYRSTIRHIGTNKLLLVSYSNSPVSGNKTKAFVTGVYCIAYIIDTSGSIVSQSTILDSFDGIDRVQGITYPTRDKSIFLTFWSNDDLILKLDSNLKTILKMSFPLDNRIRTCPFFVEDTQINFFYRQFVDSFLLYSMNSQADIFWKQKFLGVPKRSYKKAGTSISKMSFISNTIIMRMDSGELKNELQYGDSTNAGVLIFLKEGCDSTPVQSDFKILDTNTYTARIQFTGLATDSIHYIWGDGSSSTYLNSGNGIATHTYLPGLDSVKIEVSVYNGCGKVSKSSQWYHICGKPALNLIIDSSKITQQIISLHLSRKMTDSIICHWGDGIIQKLGSQSPNTITHKYNVGTDSVLIKITMIDKCGRIVYWSKTIVFCTKPIINLRIDSSQKSIKKISIDYLGKISDSFRFEWGDGTLTTRKSDTKIYIKEGTYILKCVVKNSCGLSDSLKREIKIANNIDTLLSVLEDKSSGITVYPNPANDYIQILNDKKENITQVEIIDQLGRIVRKYKNVNFEVIDLSGILSGTYILKLNLQSGKVLQFKLLKKAI